MRNSASKECSSLQLPGTGLRNLGSILLLLALASCGGGGNGEASRNDADQAAQGESTAPTSDLTEWEIENGIGPITEKLDWGPIDPARAARGEEIFTLKCSACHKLDERYVAPPLRDVTQRRTPEFVLNMILNPLEMTQRHPVTKGLLAEYFTPMTPQGLTEEDAWALLDYLRQALADGPAGG